MKKNLLALAALAMTFSASAEVVSAWVEGGNHGLTTDKAQVDGQIVIAEAAGVGSLKLAYADSWGLGGIDANGYNSLKVNGVDLGRVGSGAVGTANPAGWSVTTAATGGAAFQYTAEKDGYLTIPSKYSTNKNYWVFEGLAGEGELCEAYTLGMQLTDIPEFPTGRLEYSLPADKDGYLDLNAADLDKYVSGTTIMWPEKIILGADAPDVKKNGYGVMMFPVYAGCNYIFGAQGSKMTCPGFVFSTEAPTAVIYGDGEEAPAPMTFAYPTAEGGDTNGIENIVADELNENAPIYNVMGQRVNKDYKGVLIQNGKKFMNF
ncbi:MAG: hypothetical protein NC212_06830 [Staphylococcus sp.]|nr:hypothetical protein [Staphylococcus sp.]